MRAMNLIVSDARLLTPTIKLIELRNIDGSDLPPFEAGAHLEIATPCGLRRYSFANDPAERHRYVSAVLRSAGGRGGSEWIHDEVTVGSSIECSTPRQHFSLDESAEMTLLFAAGIGITPLLSMAHRLRRIARPFHLYYCSRTRRNTAFLHELSSFERECVTMHHSEGLVERRFDASSVMRDCQQDAHIYVCGPAGFIDAIRSAAAEAGRKNVHVELFEAPRTSISAQANSMRSKNDFHVVLRRTNHKIFVPSDKSILDALFDAGITVSASCEDGWCGLCTVDVVSGAIDHRDSFLSEEDKQSGKKIQICVSRAMHGGMLVLDL
jgi:vanillate monooxygenase ferredoxin subunit